MECSNSRTRIRWSPCWYVWHHIFPWLAFIGPCAVVHDNFGLFSNFSDGQVYKVDIKHRSFPIPITSTKDYRFADFACHPEAPNLVVCILEDHTRPAPKDVANSLVVLNTDSSENPVTLVSGNDFYASPRFNTDGTLLAWTEWGHPDMPWDGFVVFRYSEWPT